MQLIKPKQISGEIMTLFEEAEKKVIIISPYYKIAKWYKLLNCFEDLKRRKIDVEFYVRDKEWESIAELQSIGVQPICIPNLHTKLYMNEQSAIVSSMNLLLSSDTNSLDIALKTQSKEEYQDHFDYYKRYIKESMLFNETDSNEHGHNYYIDLESRLVGVLGSGTYINFKDGKLNINGRNKYEAYMYNDRTNELRVSGILSQKEFQFVQSNTGLFIGKRMSMEVIAGNKGFYDTIWGIVKNFKSGSIHNLIQEERQDIFDLITKFISAVEKLKKMV